jgi:DNA-binding GntR family transcriptional regulator
MIDSIPAADVSRRETSARTGRIMAAMKAAKDDQTIGRNRVSELLQNLILEGNLAPGERLAQQRLARRFGVAQGVIRESLLELKTCGLVEITDGMGATVRPITIREVVHACNIREALEGMAARLCCFTASRDELNELEQLAKEVDAAGLAGRVEEMAPLDLQFHQRVVQLTGNEMLMQLADSYRALMQLADSYRALSRRLQVHEEGETVPARHAVLVQAMKDNDPDLAERLMREHIRVGVEELKAKYGSSSSALRQPILARRRRASSGR